MSYRFKKILLTDAANTRIIIKKEYYSFSLLNRLQRLHLFFKTHIGWRLHFLYDTILNKNGKAKFSNKTTFIHEKPIVYSCSGCSSTAQMANYVALQLDRKELAEMSCIVGVGGNVKKLVRKATSGRKIITIDGCALACSNACLGNHSLKPDKHFVLTGMGVKKMSMKILICIKPI